VKNQEGCYCGRFNHDVVLAVHKSQGLVGMPIVSRRAGGGTQKWIQVFHGKDTIDESASPSATSVVADQKRTGLYNDDKVRGLYIDSALIHVVVWDRRSVYSTAVSISPNAVVASTSSSTRLSISSNTFVHVRVMEGSTFTTLLS
jgi:hypothetical protein